MTGIVDRLRFEAQNLLDRGIVTRGQRIVAAGEMRSAADEIERLRNWQAAAAAWIRTDVKFSPDILHDGELEHGYLLLSQVDDASSPSVSSVPDASSPRASGRSAVASPGGGGVGGVSVTSADVPKPAPKSDMWSGMRI